MRTAHSLSSIPASRRKRSTRSDFRRLPSRTVTTADMLSVTASSATPPKRTIVASRHESRSSSVRVGEYARRCILDHPSVALKTLSSKTSPSASVILSDSFQPDCSWRPGGVSNLGCGSAPPPPQATPCSRHQWVKAL